MGRVRRGGGWGNSVQFFHYGRRRKRGPPPAVRISPAELEHVLELAAGIAGGKIWDRLLMVTAGEHRRNREELTLMRERGLRPRLDDDVVGFLVVGAVALLILDGREGPSEYLGLARLVAAADSKFDPATAQHVEHRGLLRDSNRMPPSDDIGGLAETDLPGAHGDRGFCKQRIRTELLALGLVA